ncbi:MAG: HPr(Ser) kinase/phosphatase [Candidatus Sumerlaeaceae bacterium]|nr:HPr(Ser) kinase/phosphatase [Candidatus Sumerlaeaceae bacterium]
MMASEELTVETLVRERGRELDLTVVAGESGLGNKIRTPELTRPGLAFAGFFDVFSYDRIQILGNTEMSYLRSLDPTDRAARLERTLSYRIPCMLVTNNNEIPSDFLEKASAAGIPILRTSLLTTRLVSLLIGFLDRYFAPVLNIHADLLDVYGMGALIMGSSGVGKSECALELVERGHRLVADDIVILRRISKEEIVGRSSELLKYHMEIRGLGILNIERLFGVASVVDEKRVDLVVQLERWNEGVEYERLGIDDKFYPLLDVEIPMYTIPVQPGRNNSIMVEMAALTQRLKNRGDNQARQMEDRLTHLMNQASNNP